MDASRPDRRQPVHIGELNKRATDADDPDLRERITSLKATRDQAKVHAERARATLHGSGQTITAAMLARFAMTARERMRIDGTGYRRDHLRALAQRVEVADTEVRIMGSKGALLRTFAARVGRNQLRPTAAVRY